MSLPGVITLVEVISTPFITAFWGPPSNATVTVGVEKKSVENGSSCLVNFSTCRVGEQQIHAFPLDSRVNRGNG